MKNKNLIWLLFASLVISLVVLAGCNVNVDNDDGTTQTVDVSGSYELKVKPDNAVVSISVKTTELTAKKSQEKNAEIMEKIRNAFIAEGLSEDDMKTLNFNIYEEYDYSYGGYTLNERKFLGYTVDHTLEVTIDDIDDVGKYLDIAVKNGANQINSIRFEITEEHRNNLKKEALKKATEDAKDKAEAIAAGLDKKVGKVTKISDQSFDFIPYYFREGAAIDAAEVAKVSTEISPGDVQVNARVGATFELI